MLKLINDDCIAAMQKIPENSIDFILCDLPYGCTACKWDIIIPFEKLWEQYNRILKPDGVAALFTAQSFTTKMINSNFKDFRYCWYWIKNNKTGFSYARYQPMRQLEEIAVFYKRSGRYKPQGIKPYTGKQRDETIKTNVYAMRGKKITQKYTGYPTHILKYNGVTSLERKHPTQKPVKLLEYLVKTYTNEGETVLDNCMGSGSTAIACLNTGRRFIGIELDPEYYDVACCRIGEWYVNTA